MALFGAKRTPLTQRREFFNRLGRLCDGQEPSHRRPTLPGFRCIVASHRLFGSPLLCYILRDINPTRRPSPNQPGTPSRAAHARSIRPAHRSADALSAPTQFSATLERRIKIAAMRANGMTLRAIATIFGVAAERIRQIELHGDPPLEQRAAHARFPEFRPDLAVRLAERFPDDAAVCAAADKELLSLRGVGSVQFAKLRARYPRPHEDAPPEPQHPRRDGLINPLPSGARPFAPSIDPDL